MTPSPGPPPGDAPTPRLTEEGPGGTRIGLRDLVRSDAEAAGLANPVKLLLSLTSVSPFWLVALHRVAHALHVRKVKVLPNALCAVGIVVWGADIGPGATIGPRLVITHSSGIVVGSDVVAGSDLILFSGVVLGSSARSRADWQSNQPRLGDRVVISSHAVVAGAITIGDDAVIGANVVVLEDLPTRHIVRTVPPKVEPRTVHPT